MENNSNNNNNTATTFTSTTFSASKFAASVVATQKSDSDTDERITLAKDPRKKYLTGYPLQNFINIRDSYDGESDISSSGDETSSGSSDLSSSDQSSDGLNTEIYVNMSTASVQTPLSVSGIVFILEI